MRGHKCEKGKGSSFTLEKGDKAADGRPTCYGIIGTFNAGKSSILRALTNICPLDAGQIKVENIDISTLPQSKLRDAFTVILSDHKILEGSLRFNVDPLGLHDDEKVEKKLRTIGKE